VDLRNGLHITDHDIFAQSSAFTYNNPKNQEIVGGMKLQTHIKIKATLPKISEIGLVNMSINASSFLPRQNTPENNAPVWIFAIIRPAKLNTLNTIALKDGEPVVLLNREKPFNPDDSDLQPYKELTKHAKETLEKVLDITFIPGSGTAGKFKPLELGGVAHELGTIPMKGPSTSEAPYFVDENLKLRGYDGVYVCDLSVFPSSPAANPTLTLAALSLRLSRDTLLPRPDIAFTQDPDYVYVVNASGQQIKVFVADRASVVAQGENIDIVLNPGEREGWKRTAGTSESVYVFRLKFADGKMGYLEDPQFFTAVPGRVTEIF